MTRVIRYHNEPTLIFSPLSPVDAAYEVAKALRNGAPYGVYMEQFRDGSLEVGCFNKETLPDHLQPYYVVLNV